MSEGQACALPSTILTGSAVREGRAWSLWGRGVSEAEGAGASKAGAAGDSEAEAVGAALVCGAAVGADSSMGFGAGSHATQPRANEASPPALRQRFDPGILRTLPSIERAGALRPPKSDGCRHHFAQVPLEGPERSDGLVVEGIGEGASAVA